MVTPCRFGVSNAEMVNFFQIRAVPSEGVLVVAARHCWVALHQDAYVAAGPNALDRLPDGVQDTLCLVGDDEHLGRVIGLELVRIVRRKADGVALVAPDLSQRLPTFSVLTGVRRTYQSSATRRMLPTVPGSFSTFVRIDYPPKVGQAEIPAAVRRARSLFLVQPALDPIQSFENRNNQHGHKRIPQAGFCLGLGQPAALDEEGKCLLPIDLVHRISPDACAPDTLWNGAFDRSND
jgi:hypothetical protein